MLTRKEGKDKICEDTARRMKESHARKEEDVLLKLG
jgi:hypothetical protein